MTRLLYFIFFLSGASGLVYEVVWVRLTGLVFGNTSFSIATVLGAFMSGLALGSWWLGSMVDRSERPLRLYGILEILIGISALLVPFAFRAVDTLYWSVGAELSEIAGADTLVRFITSFVIMLVPTFLMGGTLPVLTRFFVQRNEEVGSKVGTLYALNTFGAACGTLVAALVLIPGLGNQLTTVWIASLNVGSAFWRSARCEPGGCTRIGCRGGRNPTSNHCRQSVGSLRSPDSGGFRFCCNGL